MRRKYRATLKAITSLLVCVFNNRSCHLPSHRSCCCCQLPLLARAGCKHQSSYQAPEPVAANRRYASTGVEAAASCTQVFDLPLPRRPPPSGSIPNPCVWVTPLCGMRRDALDDVWSCSAGGSLQLPNRRLWCIHLTKLQMQSVYGLVSVINQLPLSCDESKEKGTVDLLHLQCILSDDVYWFLCSWDISSNISW